MCCPLNQSAPRIAVRDVIFIIVNTIIIIIISVILKIIIILQIEVGKLLNFIFVVSFSKCFLIDSSALGLTSYWPVWFDFSK